MGVRRKTIRKTVSITAHPDHSSGKVARNGNQDDALLKSLKCEPLKPIILRKHHNDLRITTSNSLNETHRERHEQLLEAREELHLGKLIESRQAPTRSHSVATINCNTVEGLYKIRYLSSEEEMKPCLAYQRDQW